MAVGLGPLPTLHPVPGFELGIASAGIKRPGRKDVVVMRCAEGSRVAGVTTTNAFCAAPVIVTRRGALPEYVVEGETGWIAPPDNPGALAAALREALADPERLRRMGAAGRSWFNQQRQQEEKALTTLYLAAKTPGLHQ